MVFGHASILNQINKIKIFIANILFFNLIQKLSKLDPFLDELVSILD
jgi:hypothetical protein